MATVTDEFIIRLGLDPTSFRKGREAAEVEFGKAKEASRSAAKSMEESNKNLANTFNTVKNEVLGFYAALLGGRALKEFITDTTEAAAHLGRFAQNIGAMPYQIAGWEAAIERMGGTAEDADKSLDSMSKALFDVHTRGQALPQDLYRLQGGLGKIATTTFDTEHGVVRFMNDVATQAQKLAAIDPQAAFRLLQGAGIGEGTANTMIKYGAGMGAYVEGIGNSIAPTKEAIDAAQDLQNRWAETKQIIEGIGNKSLPALDKGIRPILEYMDQELQKISSGVAGFKLPGTPGVTMDPTAGLPHSFGDFFKLPSFDWGKIFGSAHATENNGADTLKIQGGEVSHGNPIPVDIVKASGGGDPNSLLGGGSAGGGEGGGSFHYSGSGSGGTGSSAGLRMRGSAGVGGWWTPERMQHATERLQKEAGLSEMGAAGLVARWAGVEASGGPTSRNPSSGAYGIGQWLGSRRFGNPDFDAQIGHAVGELNSSESRAAQALRSAKTPADAARGASMFERAEGYNARTGVDNWTAVTPVGKVLGAIHHSTPFHQPAHPATGARLSSLAGSHGATTSSSSNAFHIAQLHVDARGHPNADGIANDISASLERSTMTMMSQSGQV